MDNFTVITFFDYLTTTIKFKVMAAVVLAFIFFMLIIHFLIKTEDEYFNVESNFDEIKELE